MEKSVINIDELAFTLGISRPKAYELAHSDGFPCVMVGRRMLVPVAALNQWLAEQAVKSAGKRG